MELPVVSAAADGDDDKVKKRPLSVTSTTSTTSTTSSSGPQHPQRKRPNLQLGPDARAQDGLAPDTLLFATSSESSSLTSDGLGLLPAVAVAENKNGSLQYDQPMTAELCSRVAECSQAGLDTLVSRVTAAAGVGMDVQKASVAADVQLPEGTSNSSRETDAVDKPQEVAMRAKPSGGDPAAPAASSTSTTSATSGPLQSPTRSGVFPPPLRLQSEIHQRVSLTPFTVASSVTLATPVTPVVAAPLTSRSSVTSLKNSTSPSSPSPGSSSPLPLSAAPAGSSASPTTPSSACTAGISSPLTLASCGPLVPAPIPRPASTTTAYPLSPTAIARHRFLSTHFQMPEVPVAEVANAEGTAPAATLEDAEHESSGLCGEGEGSEREERRSWSASSTERAGAVGSEDALAAAPSSPPLCSSSSSTSSIATLLSRTASRRSADSDVTELSSSGSGPPPPDSNHPELHHHQQQQLELSPEAVRRQLAAAPTPSSPPAEGRRNSVKGAASGKERGCSVRGAGGRERGSVKGGGGYVTYVQRVVTEIVETERMYVASLQDIIKGYLEPLEAQLVSGDYPTAREDIACLFCNIRDIFQFGKVFLADLEQCGLDPVKVAECFVKHINGFVIYTDYCTNYPRAVEVLTRFMQDAHLSELCKECQTALGHGLPLGAYLLRPVQRVLKYHLLLHNLVKNSEPGRPGHETLQRALAHTTDMAHHINEMKRRHEHAVRIQEVQSQLEDYAGEDLTRLGELVLEGSFRVYGAKASRQVFLFEKSIVFSKKKPGGMLACKASIPISNLMLVEVIPDEPLSFHIIPFDNPRAQHTLQARSMEQKRKWCQEIKRLILDSYKAIPDSVKSLVMELGRSHDNDYIGGTDSPRKHQHTAPEYLEKRRFRRKSGSKAPDINSLIKLPKSAAKRDRSADKNKSPKAWRKSDSKLISLGNRERSTSVPMMMSSACSTSLLPGLQTGIIPLSPTTSQQLSSGLSASDNNNNKSPASDGGREQISNASTSSSSSLEVEEDETGGKRRHLSFKRAVSKQPVLNDAFPDLDLPAVVTVSPDPQDRPTSGKAMATEAETHEEVVTVQRRRRPQSQQRQSGGSESGGGVGGGSGSDMDTSQDSGRGRKMQDQEKRKAIYGSMPALPATAALERKPARKHRHGHTRSGIAVPQKDLDKNVDVMPLTDTKEGSVIGLGSEVTRQYRRRWEAQEEDASKRIKVPALYDTFSSRHSRTKRTSAAAKLTNWNSVEKLTHGSLSDLSHLKDDPWVKNADSPPPASSLSISVNSPFAQSNGARLGQVPKGHSRSQSVSALNTHLEPWDGALPLKKEAVLGNNHNSWSSGNNRDSWGSGSAISKSSWNNTATPTRPRNYSDASNKENLDWMVYLRRNSRDPDLRERAQSLSTVLGRSSSTDSIDLSRPGSKNSTGTLTPRTYSGDLSTQLTKVCSSIQSVLTSRNSASSLLGLTDPALNVNDKGKTENLTTTSSYVANHDAGMLDKTQSGKPNKTLNTNLCGYEKNSTSSIDMNETKLKDTLSKTVKPDQKRHTISVHKLVSPVSFNHTLPENVRQGMLSPKQNSCNKVDKSYQQEATLGAESERLVAEMERYCESNSSPLVQYKFPPLLDDDVSITSASTITEASQLNTSVGSGNRNSAASSICSSTTTDTNRLSMASSVSSTSSTDAVSSQTYYLLRDVNPNRLSGVSGVSSISTSSYDSHTSTSSEGLMASLKTKVSTWTHKLGSGTGRKFREEEGGQFSQHEMTASRGTLGSASSAPQPHNPEAELREVLKEHALGSSMMGSRMAQALPAQNDYRILSKSGSSALQAASEKSLCSAANATEADRPCSKKLPGSDVGDVRKTSSLPGYTRNRQHREEDESEIEDPFSRNRLASGSSTASDDSIYERRFSIALVGLEASKDQVDAIHSTDEPQVVTSPRRKSIKEVVQYIEDKYKPRHQVPVEVRKKEPGALIKERLQSLHDHSTYRGSVCRRSVSEDRAGWMERSRESTPDSPRTSINVHQDLHAHRFSGGNQFLHSNRASARVAFQPTYTERGRQSAQGERGRPPTRERGEKLQQVSPAADMVSPGLKAQINRAEGEVIMPAGTATPESGSNSEAVTLREKRPSGERQAERCQSDPDMENLVTMRGWVKSLIVKFQQKN